MAVKLNHDSNKFTRPVLNARPLTKEQIDEQIAKKAYELYEKRGRVHGFAEKDWLKAQKIVLTELHSNKLI